MECIHEQRNRAEQFFYRPLALIPVAALV